MPNKDTGILAGLRIMVTRPAHQAGHLCQLIEERGARVLPYPVIEIQPLPLHVPIQQKIDQLDSYQIAIFVSANAVAAASRLIRADLPTHLKIAAIGNRTAEALSRHGWPASILPSTGSNSEALLASPEMQQIKGARVLIFRGVGGRELLAETLRRRGARVDYAEVYRRVIPGTAREQKPERKELKKIGIIIVTSNEGLRNLVTLLNGQDHDPLFGIPLAVISRRTAKLAEELGFRGIPVVAREASDRGLVEAIVCWWQERGRSDNRGGKA